jgi:hypothetical protein
MTKIKNLLHFLFDYRISIFDLIYMTIVGFFIGLCILVLETDNILIFAELLFIFVNLFICTTITRIIRNLLK